MIDGIKIVKIYKEFKAVFPEWAWIACGVLLLIMLLALLAWMISHFIDKYIDTIFAWVFVVSIIAIILVAIFGAIFHDTVLVGEYYEVEIDWDKVNEVEFLIRYDYWAELDTDNVEHSYIRYKKPG